MKASDIKAMWNEGNDSGEGYYACNCDVDCICDINELYHLGELVVAAGASDDSIALYEDSDGLLIAVGMLGGPWAVDVEQPTMAREWFDQFDGRDHALANVDDAPASVDQEWENGITILTFGDCSSVVFDEMGVFFEEAYK